MRDGKHADLALRDVLRLLANSSETFTKAICLFSLLGTDEFSTAASHMLEGEAGLKGLNVLMDPNWTLLYFDATTVLEL